MIASITPCPPSFILRGDRCCAVLDARDERRGMGREVCLAWSVPARLAWPSASRMSRSLGHLWLGQAWLPVHAFDRKLYRFPCRGCFSAALPKQAKQPSDFSFLFLSSFFPPLVLSRSGPNHRGLVRNHQAEGANWRQVRRMGKGACSGAAVVTPRRPMKLQFWELPNAKWSDWQPGAEERQQRG